MSLYRITYETEDLDEGVDVIGSQVDWLCLNASEFTRKRPPVHGDLKHINVGIDEESKYGFISNIWRWRGTTIRHIWPQIISVSFTCCLVSMCVWWMSGWGEDHHGTRFEMPADIQQVHNILAATLGYLVVGRSTQAFSNYIEGRKLMGGICNNVREVAQLVYASKLKPTCDQKKVKHFQVVIRRKLNLLFTFIRHQLRESHQGFPRGCEIYGCDFATHWHLDPCKPAVGNLISVDEKQYYHTKPTSLRPAIIQAELNVLANQLAECTMYPGFFVQMFHKNTAQIMDCFKSAYTIVETDVPMPYQHLLYILIYVYTFITPVIYCPDIASKKTLSFHNISSARFDELEKESNYKFLGIAGLAASLLIAISYYGIMEVAAKLHNPFGYDDIDHDIEVFGIRCHNETLIVSKSVLAGELPNYIDGVGLGLEWVKWNPKKSPKVLRESRFSSFRRSISQG